MGTMARNGLNLSMWDSLRHTQAGSPGGTLGQAMFAKTPADAPRTVTIGTKLDQEFGALFADHLADGRNERGGTLVINHQGGFELIHQGASRSGNHFFPDLDAPSGQVTAGTFHTHVETENLLKSPDNPKGLADVAPGGGDIAFALEHQLHVNIVRANGMDFMLVRTQQTPEDVNPDQVRADYQRELDARTVSGRTVRTSDDVTQELAREFADKYGFAYYEGKNGSFTRVGP
jgi:hypothetical protein